MKECKYQDDQKKCPNFPKEWAKGDKCPCWREHYLGKDQGICDGECDKKE